MRLKGWLSSFFGSLAFVSLTILITSCGSSSSSGTGVTTGAEDTTASLSCTPASASESGGKLTCTLSLSGSTTEDVTVEVAYSGTATAGTDYSGNTTTHTISAGDTDASWTITGKSDTDTGEGDETIVVDVTSVTNATENSTQQVSLTLEDAVCGKTGKKYRGCYSDTSDSDSVWNGACAIDSVDAGEYVYLNFRSSAKCNFKWVRADGSVGVSWEKLGLDSLANWTDDEFLIQHTKEKVHKIRLCVNGVDDTDENATCL